MSQWNFKRVFGRLVDDLKIIRLTLNWPEILLCKIKHKDFGKVRLRNGLEIKSPENVRLELLFHEIWIKRIYSPASFEIRDEDVVIDVGANIGLFSLFAASQATNVRVLGFEPSPVSFDWFVQNVENNQMISIEPINSALGKDCNPLTLYLSDEWVRHSASPQSECIGRISVPSTTLTNILEDVGKCDLLKIDCEGGEYDIFYSTSQRSLSKIGRIVGEYHEIDTRDKNWESLNKYLTDNGFLVTFLEDFKDGTGSFCAVNRNFKQSQIRDLQ